MANLRQRDGTVGVDWKCALEGWEMGCWKAYEVESGGKWGTRNRVGVDTR